MECGSCTVCCTLSVVPELDKGAGEQCKHCDKSGCQIYGNHPKSCKDFECAYLEGGNNIELRPDKCGVMFFKKNERIFCGAIEDEKNITDMARGQIADFNRQGYSVVLLKVGEKPHIVLADGHTTQEIYKEYTGLLKHGNL